MSNGVCVGEVGSLEGESRSLRFFGREYAMVNLEIFIMFPC